MQTVANAGSNEIEILDEIVIRPTSQHGSPDDVARTVLFVLHSRFVTGQVVYVDGGRHLLEARAGRP